ncbi:MAG: Cysteine--tRNA ligase [Holosporales bacterium]
MITLYNSRTRKKEVFKPLEENAVGLYVCGPTVYDLAHIGNARPVVVFDVLFRVLKKHYQTVTYVRNITDVDDKIITAAKEKNISIKELTTITTKAFHEDMEALFSLSPTYEPRATDHIQDMVSIIEVLIKKGFAYEREGHVLFRTKNFKSYGTLSLKNIEDMMAGARVEIAPYKEYVGDFVLWKPSLEDQPGWDSPFGYGRPGWHIECSAMSKHFLGKEFDIHGGGIDLIFPHHENENAQSCCANETSIMANFWMHNGHLTVDGTKMSKSLGNFLTVKDLRQKWHPEVIRLSLLSSHYRQPLDFNDDLMDNTKQSLDRFYNALSDFENVLPEPFDDVENALMDDLNTPLAIYHLHQATLQLNKTKDKKIAAKIKGGALLLGILNGSCEQWFRQALNKALSEEEIFAYINARNQARADKDFKTSDDIRRMLKEKGVILDDSKSGTTWRYE